MEIPENYLGADLSQMNNADGDLCWAMSSDKYCQALVKNVEDTLSKKGLRLPSKCFTPLKCGYKPELDCTGELKAEVDCGRARRARYDPEKGLQRLVTERVSKAEATQRAGRAGRVAAGRCYRMWARAEEGALEYQLEHLSTSLKRQRVAWRPL